MLLHIPNTFTNFTMLIYFILTCNFILILNILHYYCIIIWMLTKYLIKK